MTSAGTIAFCLKIQTFFSLQPTRDRLKKILKALSGPPFVWHSIDSGDFLWCSDKHSRCSQFSYLGCPIQCDQIGRFIGLWAIFWSLWLQLICPNFQHSKAIFVKVLKSIIFLVKSFLGNFYRNLAIFFWSHWPHLNIFVFIYFHRRQVKPAYYRKGRLWTVWLGVRIQNSPISQKVGKN